jgi:predicted outer membrane repeat protein
MIILLLFRSSIAEISSFSGVNKPPTFATRHFTSPISYFITDSHFSSLLDSALRIASDPKTFSDLRYRKRLRIVRGDLIVCRSVFEKSRGQWKGGGALLENCGSIEFSDCFFQKNNATFGGAVYSVTTGRTTLTRMCFLKNKAEYMGGAYLDGTEENARQTIKLSDVNFTSQHATEWTGALRTDHGGGSVTSCAFCQNSARAAGAFFDFAWKPSKRFVSDVAFFNNSADIRAGAFCGFHVMHLSSFTNCFFGRNFCRTVAASIYIESVDSIVEVNGCAFEGDENTEIGIRFNGSVVVFQGRSAFRVEIEPDEVSVEPANFATPP